MSPEDYKDGLIYTDYQKPGDAESVIPSRLLWALGNYSRFVRPGMQRVAINGEPDDIRGLMRTAYIDANARRVIAVYVNVAETPFNVTARFDAGSRGWRHKRTTPWVTSGRDGDELKPYPPVKAGEAFQIPGRSVVTFVTEFDSTR
ncbi:MAG: hypothetical protein QM757_16410 [Paludibaculum sp.]